MRSRLVGKTNRNTHICCSNALEKIHYGTQDKLVKYISVFLFILHEIVRYTASNKWFSPARCWIKLEAAGGPIIMAKVKLYIYNVHNMMTQIFFMIQYAGGCRWNNFYVFVILITCPPQSFRFQYVGGVEKPVQIL